MQNETATTTRNTTKPSFSIKAALKKGWKVFTENPAPLLVLVATIILIQFVGAFIADALPAVFQPLLSIGMYVLQLFISVTLIDVSLRLIRGESIAWREAADQMIAALDKTGLVWKYFLTSFVSGLLVVLGFIFFIIPGIYLSLRFMFALFAVIDEDAGVGEALSRSGELTEGIKMKLLVFSIIGGLINIIGAIPFGLCLLVTVPVVALAGVDIYDQAKQARPVTAETK